VISPFSVPRSTHAYKANPSLALGAATALQHMLELRFGGML